MHHQEVNYRKLSAFLSFSIVQGGSVVVTWLNPMPLICADSSVRRQGTGLLDSDLGALGTSEQMLTKHPDNSQKIGK